MPAIVRDDVKVCIPVETLMAYAQRIEHQGHLSKDFQAERGLNPELIVVAPVRAPGTTAGGIHTPGTAVSQAKPGQFCMSHIVVAVPYKPFIIWEGTECERELCIGDVIKAQEAFFDPLDGEKHSGLCTLPKNRIRAVVFSRTPVGARDLRGSLSRLVDAPSQADDIGLTEESLGGGDDEG